MASIAMLSFYSGVVDRGVETFVAELAERLSKKHKVAIFQAGSIIQNPTIRTYQIKSGAQIPKSSYKILSKIYLDLQSLKILIFSIKSILKLAKGNYDIVIPLNGGWQVVVIKILSIFTKSKIIISAQAGIGADDAWNLFFRPDVFVTLTKSQENWAKKLTSEVNIVNIPNGVDLSRFHPKVKSKKLTLQKPIVICVGALVPYKRIEETIRAVAKAKTLSLLVLGDGELRGNLDSLGKRLLGQRYQRLTIAHSAIPAYYRAGDVFTLGSKTEAFGTSYIEAMACNLPVVATNDESRREIIGDAGILTDPTDINKYALDLKIAASTNYRNAPYNQALKFSWNKVAASYQSMIFKLMTK